MNTSQDVPTRCDDPRALEVTLANLQGEKLILQSKIRWIDARSQAIIQLLKQASHHSE